MPSSALEDSYLVSQRLKIVLYPSSLMIGKQQTSGAQLLQRSHAQVVGMAVGDPRILAMANRSKLLFRNLVRHSPAAEVRVGGQPRVRDQDWESVVADDSPVRSFQTRVLYSLSCSAGDVPSLSYRLEGSHITSLWPVQYRSQACVIEALTRTK
jgi:hypothetical protein